MNDTISNNSEQIFSELQIQHQGLEGMTKTLSIDIMRVIANTARRFFQISNDTPKSLDQQQHLQYLIGRLDRAIVELDQPEISDSAIAVIWHSIHRNSGGMITFEEINKYLK